MRRPTYEPLRSPDHVLDPLRNRVAEILRDGRAEGFVSTRVEAQWNRSTGKLWWKTWTHPYEVLVFEISWVADGEAYLYDDGVEDSSSETVQEFLRGTVRLHGDPYELRWLTGEELLAAELLMGVAEMFAAPDRSGSG
jgi:hypothetical protein